MVISEGMIKRLNYGPKLRKLRTSVPGLTQKKLAEELSKLQNLHKKEGEKSTNFSDITISRWEKNTSLRLGIAELYGEYFDIDPLEIFSSTDYDELAEDATPYEIPSDNMYHQMLENPHNVAFQINDNILDQKSIYSGDILIFNTSKEKMKQLKDGDIVVAQQYDEKNSFAATRIIRQYVAPSSLITNSIHEKPQILQLLKHNITIMGVMITAIKADSMFEFQDKMLKK